MGATVLVFEVEPQKMCTTWIPFYFERGLGRVSKSHVGGRWKKALKNTKNREFYDIEISQL